MKWGVLLVGLLGTLAGCTVQEFPPELWAVNPKQFEIGRTITLTGAQFGADPIVTFGEGATAVQATVKSKEDGKIEVFIPRIATGPTQIQVANSQGLTPPVAFTVLQPQPLITDIIPRNTPPGGALKITGENLDKAVAIRFDTTRATSFTVVSPNEVLIVVPTQLPKGFYAINYQTEGGSTSRQSYLVAGTPVITGFTPKRSRAGQEIVITGQYLADGQVFVNRSQADVATVRGTNTEIRAIIPRDATSGRISVVTFGSSDSPLRGISADSIYLAGTPVLAGAPVPSEGIAGDKVLLNGFSLRDVSSVTVGAINAPFRILSDTQIEVTIPARPQAGDAAIVVSGLGGTATGPQPFFYILPPSNIAFTPLRRGAGKLVTITGQNLWRIQTVTLNGKPVTLNSRTEGSELGFLAPNESTPGVITVTNRAGTATSARSLTIVGPVGVTDYPRRLAENTRMVIKGSWLRDAVVQFTGAANPAPFDGRNDDAEIWVRIPPDAQSGSFRITNDANGAFTSETVTIIRPVSNITFTPTSAKVGDEITVTGTFSEDVTDIRFGGGASLAATFQKGFNSLKVIVPANASTGTICLTNPAGLACSAGTFTVLRPVAGLSFTPRSGLRGTDITITGQNLTDVTEVRFGSGKSAPATFRRVGGTLVVTVPADATTGTICLTNGAGTVCTTESYTVLIPIANVATTATTAKVGTDITLTGDNITLATEVRFSGGRSGAARFRVVNNTLVVTVPADAQTGTICATNDAGTVCTTASITITP
jgi:hypothetical protein